MRALISTTQHLLHLDLETGAVTVLDNTEPEYYGITWRPSSDGLVLSHSGVDNATLLTLEAYARSEQGWLTFPGGRTERFLSAPHQILWCSDGRVVASNTGRNRIVAVDPQRPGHYQEAGVSEERWDRLAPQGPFGDHLNSVFEADGKLYVIAHGHSHGAKLAIFSYPDLSLVSVEPVRGRTGLHNIFVAGGLQLSCHSEAAALVDLASGEVLWEAGTPIYTRGLAVTDDHVLVGESAKTGRDLRRSSLSGVWLLDRSNWKTVDYFPLGPYGAVHEVRVIDLPDHAHHGTPLANPDKLLESAVYDKLRTARIAGSQAALASRAVWKHFDLALGTTQAEADGWRHGDGGLTIVTRRPSSANSWSVDYALNPGGHLSVIFDYDGNGGDANMTALLLQGNGQSADLSEWREDGTGWRSVRSLAAGVLETKGRLSVSVAGGEIVLASKGRIIHRQALPSVTPDKFVGLRWSGASVRPAEV